MTCAHCTDAGDVFDRRLARLELRWHRWRGPSRSSRLLLRALGPERVEGRSVLEIGGGVGTVQHALLDAGARETLDVDASPAYLEVAREEARRRGHGDRVGYRFGDVVDLAPELEPRDVVVLDRVLCCYPFARLLVATAATRARERVGMVFPREHLAARAGVGALNLLQRARGSEFRVRIHPAALVDDEMGRRGFETEVDDRTPFWRVRVYRRVAPGESLAV